MTKTIFLISFLVLTLNIQCKIGNRNNNELLIINLAAVRADEFQIPVLRQALTFAAMQTIRLYEARYIYL